MIEGRLRTSGLLCEVQTVADDGAVPQVLEEISRRTIPFAITLTAQNEAHRSLTLNILHGTPQGKPTAPFVGGLLLYTRVGYGKENLFLFYFPCLPLAC